MHPFGIADEAINNTVESPEFEGALPVIFGDLDHELRVTVCYR